MSDRNVTFGGFIPADFEGTLEEFVETQAECAANMAVEHYLKNRKSERIEGRSINSNKMNTFMMFVCLLIKVSKRHDGIVKIVGESPSGNAIAEMDNFALDAEELKIFKSLLSAGASINFEPLINGKVCVSVVVPEIFE